MDLIAALGPALRGLRKAAGLTQQNLADRSGVGFAMISRYERGAELPQLGTLLRLLDAMKLDFYALAAAIDGERGKATPLRPGTPRAAWVSVLVRHGVDPRALEGAAADALAGGDPKAEADLFASAEEAARQLTAAAVAEIRRAAARLAEKD